jgi:serine/threonine protein kinase
LHDASVLGAPGRTALGAPDHHRGTLVVSVALYENLKTTVTQALAVTMVDDSRRAPVLDGSPGPPPVLPGVGDVVGSLYRLVRLLGEGMFGKVYVAERLDVPEHRVALKLLPKSLYVGRNVERELVMLATVGHPHVVQLKDHGFAEDYVWLTMPVYHGETLGERLERGPLDLRDAYDIFLPIARGLEALHQAGLRHQDIKPENIFLAVFGGRVHPILLDLGVAAERDGTFCAGTALYASPEQLLAFTGVPGAVPLSEKMDTYCMASTLLMAILGPSRFVGEGAKSRDELAGAHEKRATRPLADEVLPQLSESSRHLLQERFKAWLALDPNARPSMSELAEQLEVLLEPEREAKREEDARLERQKTSLWRFRLIAAAMLLGGIGAVAWGYSKRETLRLAGELDKARAQGAESFDKLDTCVASHAVARSEALDCRRERVEERAEFQASLASIAESSGNSAAQAREMQTMQNRLLACEVSAEEKLKHAAAEQDRCQAERATLQTERDEARTAADTRGNEAAALLGERDQCVADRASIAADRDQCRTSIDPYHTPTPTPKPALKPPPEEPAPPPAPTSAPTTAAPPKPAPVEEAGG